MGGGGVVSQSRDAGVLSKQRAGDMFEGPFDLLTALQLHPVFLSVTRTEMGL